MKGVGATASYLNVYQGARDLLKNTVGYTDSLWKSSINDGTLDTYIYMLDQVQGNYKVSNNLMNNYHIDKLEDNAKFTALYNEVNKDKLLKNTVKHQVANLDEQGNPIYKRDTNGNVIKDEAGNPIVDTKTEELTEYDYNKLLLKQHYEEVEEQERLKMLQDEKNARGWFLNLLNTTYTGAAELALSATEGLVDWVGDVYNIGQGIVYGLQGRDIADAYKEREISLDNLGFWQSMRDDFNKFEAEYTYLRDVNGEATFTGQLLSGVGHSFGNMVPSIVITAISGGAGAPALVSNILGTTAMYVPMGAANMYDLCQNELLNSTTAEKLLNSYIKAGVELAVEKGLNFAISSVTGKSAATALDRLTYGSTLSSAAKTGKRAAFARIAKDALHEGTEEFLQTLSNYAVDRFFALHNEGYLNVSQFNMQELALSFLSGAIMSYAGSYFNILKTKRVVDTRTDNIYQVDKDGNIKVDKKGNTKLKKLSKLESFEFITNIQDVFSAANKLYNDYIHDKDGTFEENRVAAVNAIYPTLRTLSSYFGNMSEDVYAKVSNMLNLIGQADDLVNPDVIAKEFDDFTSDIIQKRGKKQLTEFLNKKAAEIKEAALRGNAEVYDRETAADVGSAEAKQIQAIFDKDKTVKTVIVSEKGKNIVNSDDGETVIVPKQFAGNPDKVIRAIIENRVQSTILSDKRFSKIIGSLKFLFKKRYHYEGDDTQVLIALLTNKNFQLDCLSTNRSEVINFVGALGAVYNTIKVDDNHIPVKKMLAKYIDAFQATLVQYYSTVIYSDFETLSNDVLSEENKQKIRREQYPYNYKLEIYSYDLAKSKNREAIINSLLIKINAMNVSKAEKETLITNIQSDNSETNRSAFKRIERYWYSTYNSSYDNFTYFAYVGHPQSIANSFLQSQGITIKDVIESPEALKKYNELFRTYSRGSYEFEMTTKSKLGVDTPTLNIVENTVQTSKMQEELDIANTTFDYNINYANTLAADTVINELVDADDIIKAQLTVNDLVYDPTLIKGEAGKALAKLTIEQRVKALTQLYLVKSNGTKSISQDYYGRYVVVDLHTISDYAMDGTDAKLKQSAADILSGKNVRFKLSDLFDIPGYAGTAEVYIIVDNGEGDTAAKYTQDNAIVIRINNADISESETDYKFYLKVHENMDEQSAQEKVSADKSVALYYTIKDRLWHEMKHAISKANRLSAGNTTKFFDAFNAKQQASIVADIERHVPSFFPKNSKYEDKVGIVKNMLYYATRGELNAYNVKGNVNNLYASFVVNVDDNGITVNAPWGSSYTIKDDGQTSTDIIKTKGEKVIKNYKAVSTGVSLEQNADYRTFQQFPEYRIGDAPFTLIPDVKVDNVKMSDKEIEQVEDAMISWVNNASFINADTRGEDFRKDFYKKLQDPVMHKNMLKYMYLSLYNNKGITYDEFLKSKVSYLRYQKSPTIIDNNTFVSATIKDDIVSSYQEEFNNAYAFTGNIEVNKILAYNDNEGEILIKPSDIKDAKVHKVISGDIVDSKINNKLTSEYNKYIKEAFTYDLYDAEFIKNNALYIVQNSNIFPEFLYNGNGYVIIDDSFMSRLNDLTAERSKYGYYTIGKSNKAEVYSKNNIVEYTTNQDVHIYNLTPETINNAKKMVKELGLPSDSELIYEHVSSKGIYSSSDYSSRRLNVSLLDNPKALSYLPLRLEKQAETEVSSAEKEFTSERSKIAKYYGQEAKRPTKIVIDGKEYTYKDVTSAKAKDKTVSKDDYLSKMRSKRRRKASIVTNEDFVRANTISYEFAKGTNLEAYVNKKTHKQQYMDYRLQNIVAFSTGIEDELDAEFVKLIKNKTFLTKGIQALKEYIRKNDMNDATFQLINKYYYQNSSIKSLEQLEDLVRAAGMAYALRGTLRQLKKLKGFEALDVDEIINRDMSLIQMKSYVNDIKTTMPEVYEIYQRIYNNFYRIETAEETSLKAFMGDSRSKAVREKATKYLALRDAIASLTTKEERADFVNLKESSSIEALNKYEEVLKTKYKDLYKIYTDQVKVYNNVNLDKKSADIVDAGLLRTMLLNNYDGSLQGLAASAAWANMLEYNESLNKAGKVKTTSTETAITGNKVEDLTVGDTLADNYTTEDLAFTNRELDGIVNEIVEYKAKQLMAQGKVSADVIATNRGMTKFISELRKMYLSNPDKTIALYNKLIAQGKLDSASNITLKEADNVDIKSDRGHLQRRTAQFAKTQLLNKMDVKSARYKKFYEKYKDLGFTKNGQWHMPKNADGTPYKYEQVEKLYDDLQEARDAFKAGEFGTKAEQKYLKEIAKLRNKVEKQQGTIHKLKSTQQTIIIGKDTIVVDADTTMPDVAKTLFDTTFKEMSKTDVKNLSSEDAYHTKKSYKKFIEINAETLGSLDSATATALLKYLLSAKAEFDSPFSEAKTKWEHVILYTYAYISRLVKDGTISIDYDLVKSLQSQYELASSSFGQLQNAIKATMADINPHKIVFESLMKRYGIGLDRTDVDQIATAMDMYLTADIKDKEAALKNVQELTNKAYQKALKNYKGDKRSFISKLIKFRTMCMLSSPGTWIRNVSTNILIEKTSTGVAKLGDITWGILNKIADKFGKGIKRRKDAKLAEPTYKLVVKEDSVNKFIEYYNLKYKGANKVTSDDGTIRGLLRSFLEREGYFTDKVTLDKYTSIVTDADVAILRSVQTEILKDYDRVEGLIVKGKGDDLDIAKRDTLLAASQMIDADINYYNDMKDYTAAKEQVPLRRTLDGQYSIVKTIKGSKYKFKENKDGTYSIQGVVVNSDVTNFIMENIFNNGLFNAIKNGLTKYEDSYAAQTGINQQVVKMILKNISSNLFYDNQFDSKMMTWLSKSLYKMLSDDKFVNRAFVKYLAATLVEDKVDLSHGITKQVMGYIADAFTIASADYMHKSSFIGDIEYKLKQRVGDKAYAMYKFIFPFANASWNWFVEGLRWTPIGLAKAIYDFSRFEKVVSMYDNAYKRNTGVNSRFAAYITKRNIGKGLVGTIGFLIGALLAGFGVCGIDTEDDKPKLRIGDLHIDFSDIYGTTGITQGIVMASAFKNGEDFMTVLSATLTDMFDDSIFSDVFDMLQNQDSLGEVITNPYYYSNIAASFVPNLWKTITSSLYIHKVKYDKGILGFFERMGVQVIPGIAYGMPKVHDIYTGEIQYKYSADFWGVVSNIVNRLGPVKFQPRTISDVQRTAMRYNITRGPLTGRYEDIGQLNAEELDILNEYYGKLNNKYLKELFKNKQKYLVNDAKGNRQELYFRQMTDKQKESVINRIMTNNATIAKIYTWTSKGHRYYATKSMYEKLQSNGIRRNVYLETKDKKGFTK